MSTQETPPSLGAQMRKEFLGEAVLSDLKNAHARTDIFAQTSQEYVQDVCFASYARPGLKFRDRSLMNIVMLIALNRGSELKFHLKAAVQNGLSQEEICEACRHAMVYCGVVAGRDALMAASEVFNPDPTSNSDTDPQGGVSGSGVIE